MKNLSSSNSNKTSLISHLIIVLIAFLLLSSVFIFELFLGFKTKFIHYPIHAILEITGSLIAFITATVLISQEKLQKGTSFNLSCAYALIGMGVFDAYHALSHAGNTFIWLHTLATITGGTLFSLVYFPSKFKLKKINLSILILLAITNIFSLVFIFYPEIVPKMQESDRFSFPANTLNTLGGILFLVASYKMYLSYKKTQKNEDVLFIFHCILFGVSSIIFHYSKIWGAIWWGWHGLRLIAYSVAAIYITRSFFFQRNNLLLTQINEKNQLLNQLEKLNLLPNGIFELNFDGLITYNNNSLQFFSNLKDLNLLKNTFWIDCFNFDNKKEEVITNWNKLKNVEDGNSVQLITYLTTKDGEKLKIRLDLSKIHHNKFIGSINNITFEDELHALQLTSEMYKKALDKASIVAFTDAKGKITYANDLFCEISGYSREELIGEDHRILNSGVMGKDFFKDLWGTIKSGHVWRGEICNKRKNGSFYWLDTTIVPSFNRKGEIKKYITIRTDITEQVKAKEDLKINIEKLTKAEEAKDQFLANISHELRTPLNGILGLITLLEDMLDGQEKEMVKTLKKSGKHLLNIINDLLDVTLLETEKIIINKESFNFIEFIENHRILFSNLASQKGLKIIYSLTDKVPKFLYASEGRITQILNNLVGNAIKFTPEGEIRIQIDSTRSENQDYLNFTIADTGIGIEEKDIAKLFKKFTQINNKTNRGYTGTGLGLVISKNLVEKMGGKIAFQSSTEKGSIFTFSVPYQNSTREDIQALGEIEVNQSKARILVVDDNELNCMIAREFLKKLGFTAQTVTGGKEALEALKVEHFDIVLLDCHMPEFDGFETMGHILKDFSRRPKVIAMTASAMEEDKKRCFDSGMDGFLSKPLDLKKLKTTIDHHLDL